MLRKHSSTSILIALITASLTGIGPMVQCDCSFCCAQYTIFIVGPRANDLPLAFEVNLGQADPQYEFLSRGRGLTAFLSRTEAVLDLRDETSRKSSILRFGLAGSQRATSVEPLEPLGGKVNYFLGNDPAKWITDIPTYERLRYHDVYPGIDLDYHGQGMQLEHDFVVRPGADPAIIRMVFEGGELHPNSDGSLMVRVGRHELSWQSPVIYQEMEGGRRKVEGRYRMVTANEVGFEIGVYDVHRPLVIDPVILYSTYVGRNNIEMGARLAVDSSGNAFLTGFTGDFAYPATPGVYQTPTGGAGQGNIVITKVNASGTAMVFSTHIGGSNSDFGSAIALDSAGNVYVTGGTRSFDFPATQEAFRTRFGPPGSPSLDPGHCFVAKVNAAGNALVYATYLGGNQREFCTAIAVDSSGNAYVTGITESADFPVSEDAFQRANRGGTSQTFLPASDGFVTKLNATGSALIYSTFFGGTANEGGAAIAVDALGNAYVAGGTNSFNFPVTPGAFQPRFAGGGGQGFVTLGDAFVIKVNPTGTGLVYSTLLGGARDDVAFGIAVDAQGNAYVTGSTLSSDYPTTPQAFQTAYRGAGGEPQWVAGDAFVTKLNPAGAALVYSTYLGGTLDDRATGIALDSSGAVWIAGNTLSRDFPVSTDAQQSANRGSSEEEGFKVGDAFLSQLNAAGSALVYSTHLGGSGGDWAMGVAWAPAGVYVSGGTASANFPTTEGVLQRGFGGGTATLMPLGDVFLARFGDRPAGPQVSISAVGNAASYVGGSVAPGEILVVTGAGIGPTNLTTAVLSSPTTLSNILAETRFLFDGVPGAMIYASAVQSAVVAPYAITGRASTQVVAEYRGVRSAAVTLPVVASKPGLFSANSSGRGLGAIQNQDLSYNNAANPAAKGTIVVLYGTGEGQTNPAGVDGQLALTVFPKPVLPVFVSFGGRRVDSLEYWGALPGVVAGVLQINVRLPEDSPSGDVPVTVTVGTATSQSGLTVAVR